ncbi:hypothetical protein BD626DRAFT_471821 [Schizophyllum amplum]|uniref:Uncharacterized protein n=1 Tax=Schizophyllum amplum TaxID=97359 RepID=A0A550CVI4_9AGAR|nr:hypothetical protein BD626DRAFT_471821 [Auriculariopsis ampla]
MCSPHRKTRARNATSASINNADLRMYFADDKRVHFDEALDEAGQPSAEVHEEEALAVEAAGAAGQGEILTRIWKVTGRRTTVYCTLPQMTRPTWAADEIDTGAADVMDMDATDENDGIGSADDSDMGVPAVLVASKSHHPRRGRDASTTGRTRTRSRTSTQTRSASSTSTRPATSTQTRSATSAQTRSTTTSATESHPLTAAQEIRLLRFTVIDILSDLTLGLRSLAAVMSQVSETAATLCAYMIYFMGHSRLLGLFSIAV